MSTDNNLPASTDSANSTQSKDSLCTVAIRVRPILDSDHDQKCIWSVSSTGKIQSTDTKRDKEVFQFDYALNGESNQLIYENAVKQSVYAALEGVNLTVLAYGQTCSGKTYSMMGYDNQPGIIPQTINEVFHIIKQRGSDYEHLLRVSYMEIYNETIKDLLSPDKNDLRIQETKGKGVFISNLTEEIVTDPIQVMGIINVGEENRRKASTDFNLNSSRSHTIFQLTVESSNQDALKISRISLIDLAGSERAASDVTRRKEGSFINKSLLTLGTVISKFVADSGEHIPFRDSKLTRLLQPYLFGNSRLCLIATINPTAQYIEESVNTLKFAARAKMIVPKPELYPVTDEKTLLKQYKEEIQMLRKQLEMFQSPESSVMSTESSTSDKERLQEKLEEANLTTTRLQERIKHMKNLILCSSNLTDKPMLDWSLSTMDLNSVMLKDGLLPHHQSTSSLSLPNPNLKKSLKQKIDDRDSLISNLKSMIDPSSEAYKLIKKFEETDEVVTPDIKLQLEQLKTYTIPNLESENKNLTLQLSEYKSENVHLKSKLEELQELLTFAEQDQAQMQIAINEQTQSLNTLELKYNNIVHEFKEYRDILQKKRPNKIGANTLQMCMEFIKNDPTKVGQMKELEEAYQYRQGLDKMESKYV